MCGISGIFCREGTPDRAALTAMRDVQSHRGPDDSGIHIDGEVGLAHRRLSIVDLASGHQPMRSLDGRYAIVFNGEIYNFKELRSSLEREGARFTTQSDTEVLLHLHAYRGSAATSLLNGIFAYALWDSRERTLLLARDRAGIKPLYVAASAAGLAFASELKALFESRWLAPALAPEAVREFLQFRHLAGSGTLFSGAEALLPGHTMLVRNGVPEAPVRYWNPLSPRPAFTGTYSEAVNALDDVLNQAVKRQLMADVPVGTFCSGGIDSSLVTAIASRHADGKVNTYSVGFGEQSYDESAYARMAAAACDSNHHEIQVTEAQFARLLPDMIWHHDLPLNFANSVHIFALSELASKDVKVILTGEGADELFFGYPRYLIPRYQSLLKALPALLRRPLLLGLGAAPDHRLRRLAAVVDEAAENLLQLNCTTTTVEDTARLAPGLPAPSMARQMLARAALEGTRDAVYALSLLEFQTYLSSILDRQDKMSMAASIEGRVPFLDNAVIDFAHSLPTAFKQTLKHRKRILKDVARRYLPKPIVDRRKSGFGVPLKEWFAGKGPMSDLLREAMSSAGNGGMFDPSALEALLKQHQAGIANHSELLWSVLNVQLWRQRFHV